MLRNSLSNLIRFKRLGNYFINFYILLFFLGSPIPSSSPYPSPSFLGTPSQGIYFLYFIILLLSLMPNERKIKLPCSLKKYHNLIRLTSKQVLTFAYEGLSIGAPLPVCLESSLSGY